MKLDKNKAYKELNRRLKVQVENSINAVHIDEAAKDRIWDNLYNEMKEERLKRKFTVRRTYRAAFVACLVLVLLVSLDLSSNASLFKRLLTSVSGNTIQFNTRDVKVQLQDDRRNGELDNKIDEINEVHGTAYVAPIIPANYSILEITNIEHALTINLMDNEKNIITIKERDVTSGQSTTIGQYNQNVMDIEKLNSNGVEYTVIHNENINIILFNIGNIEFELIGTQYDETLDVALTFN